MSDTSSTVPPVSAASASPAATAPPTIDYAALAKELAPLLTPAAPAAPAAPAPANPPSPTNLFDKGNIVAYKWDDHYDGPSSRYGIVVATLPDEGAGARSIVAWFDSVSGPIGDHDLTAA